jgi:hypothetical protein
MTMTTKPRSPKRKFDTTLATSLVLVSSLGFGIGFGAHLYPPAKKVPVVNSLTALAAPQTRASFLKSDRALKLRIIKPNAVRVLPIQHSSHANRPVTTTTVQAPQVIRRVVRVVRQTSRPVLATTQGS